METKNLQENSLVSIIQKSPLFDIEWYRKKYHLQGTDKEIILEFLEYKSCWMCSPSIYFNPEFYLTKNPDVAESNANPLLHYILHGDHEGRRPNPLFDPAYYKAQLRARGVDKVDNTYLEHYISNQLTLGISPSAQFNTSDYLRNNEDVRKAGMEPLAHYLEFGQAEQRKIRSESPSALSVNLSDTTQALSLLSRSNPADEWLSSGDLFTIGSAKENYPNCEEPKFSIIIPCYESNIYYLKLCLSSVLVQSYRNFEIIIVDDGSKRQRNREFFRMLSKIGMKVILSKENKGISHATNSGAAIARGEWILLLDHDDLLHPYALQALSDEAAIAPEAEYIFSDAAKISANGDITSYHYKPGWDPILLYTYMYAGQLLCLRRFLYEKLGGLDPNFDGCQDHDLALRVAETGCEVRHLPKILYYWRAIPGSTALAASSKPYAHDAARKSIANSLKRRGIKAKVSAADWAAKAYANFFQLKFPNTGPSVTLIIPTHDNIEMLERLVISIHKKTTYKNYSILILGDNCVSETIKKRIRTIGETVQFEDFTDTTGKFSFSKKVNAGVAMAKADYVLLLNDDTEVITPNWLSDMMGYVQIENVGAVGAQLCYPDGSIQHAGITVGLEGGRAGHVLKGLPQDSEGYLSYRSASRAVFGVTAACLVIARDRYLQVGGFDEQHFPLAYNDVDFCAKLNKQGWKNIYASQAKLVHHEGVTRRRGDRLSEMLRYKDAYGDVVDRYWNKNWSACRENIYPLHSRTRVTYESDRPIAFISHNAELQGATKVLCELAHLLERRSSCKPLFHVPDKNINYIRIKQEFDIAYLNATVSPTDTGATLAEKILHAENVLAQSAPSHVICNTLLNLPVVIAAARRRIPVIWIIHESEGVDFFADCTPLVSTYFLPQAMASATHVVFVSDACRTHYNQFDVSGNFVVIRNGVSLPQPDVMRISRSTWRNKLKLPKKEFLMLTVGTLCDRKAQQRLVSLARYLENQNVLLNARFVIIGPSSGDYQERMMREINTLGHYRNRFMFLGEISEPAGYYRAADLFVFTSNKEAYPTVLTESLAHGLPVISTPVEGAHDIIFHDDIGVVASFDELEIWRDFILKLQDAEVQAQYADSARQAINFLPQWTEVASSYHRLMEENLYQTNKTITA